MARYKLKLKRLDFISAVDTPAQETATALLVKRKRGKGPADIEATARVVKTSSDELGLVFGWALTSKSGGADYFDLHGDNIVEEDLIRIAAEFMESGGATDEQHDFENDGRVVFAMPLTAEVAKSFGIETDTTGLMVAIKPSAEVFAKFKSGEYTGFSIAGIGERIEVKSASKVVKSSLYTDEVSGHAHKICVYEDGSMYVEWATMEGAEQGHSHGIVFEGGTLTILADSGHTHQLAEGQPGVVMVPAETIVLVQASASPTTNAPARTVAHEKSTRSTAVPHGGLTKAKDQTMDPKDQEIASLKKTLAGLIALSSAEHAHYKTLSGDEQATFLAKSATERGAVVAEIAKRNEEADKVVYVSKSTGDVFKAKDDTRLVDMAKRMDEQAVAIKKAAVRKQAAEVLGNAPGDDETHDFIIEAIGSNEKAVETLKGLVATSTIGKRAPGASGGDAAESGSEGETLAKFEKGLVAFAKSKDIKNVWTDARAAYLQTEEGEALNRAYLNARNG